MINISKKYRTRNGFDVEIFKIIPAAEIYPSKHRVIGAIIQRNGLYDMNCWMLDGRFRGDGEFCYDLVEVSPYEDFKVDDKVVCWDAIFTNNQHRRYFSHVDKDGRPNTFVDGATSWSSHGSHTVSWDHCVKYVDQANEK